MPHPLKNRPIFSRVVVTLSCIWEKKSTCLTWDSYLLKVCLVLCCVELHQVGKIVTMLLHELTSSQLCVYTCTYVHLYLAEPRLVCGMSQRTQLAQGAKQASHSHVARGSWWASGTNSSHHSEHQVHSYCWKSFSQMISFWMEHHRLSFWIKAVSKLKT